MKLILAEKKSVATAIAEVVEATKAERGYFEGNGYVVSWAVGHLVELADATAYGDFKKWRLEDLPIIPQTMQYKLSANTTGQFNILKTLMYRPDIDSLICATDAGREGELIFRLIYNHAGCRKPFERLWASSLERSDIETAMQNLQLGQNYDNLFSAASARQQSDWLVGINYSRYFSCLYNKTLSVGRVQTPVLKMIANRQAEISNFVPQQYFTLTADLGDLKAYTRVNTQREVASIIANCQNHDAVVTIVKEDVKHKSPPKLFNLSDLQITASKLYGYTAQQVLDLAQTLYEKKLTTYPRTNSNYIPSSIQETLQARLANLEQQGNFAAIVQGLCCTELRNIANNKKVTDHHAIIPTMSARIEDAKLTRTELAIFNLICSRFFEALSPAHEYVSSEVMWDIGGEAFKTTGKVVTIAGWKAVQPMLLPAAPSEQEDEPPLALQLKAGDHLPCLDIRAEKKYTQPPQPYTDGTLVEAMRNVGQRVGGELKAALSEGLGTEATRAGIIERLTHMEYVYREKEKLLPSGKGLALLSVVPVDFTDAVMTAEWELKLSEIEHGNIAAATFDKEIKQYVRNYIEAHKQYSSPDPNVNFQTPRESFGKCPVCGKDVYQSAKSFHCSDRSCPFALWKNDAFWTAKGKELTSIMVKALLSQKAITLKDCTGKNCVLYDAKVSMHIENGKAKYTLSFIDNRPRKEQRHHEKT